MFPELRTPEEQIKLVEYIYARMKIPLSARIAHDDGGKYSIYDENNSLIHTGWIAGGLSAREQEFVAMANFREASQVTIEPLAVQRFLDLLNFEGKKPKVTLSGLIIPEKKTDEGVLISSLSFAWAEIVLKLQKDWSKAYDLPPAVWEELIAAAYKRAGYDEVTLTPRSGDHGRDLIAVKKGLGTVKILGSVKAYKPGMLVTKDQVHALAGVLSLDPTATKGILTTTSDFAPRLLDDRNLARAIPSRIELMNGDKLRKWLGELLLLGPIGA